ncbi:MAG TPA: hypothetical protein VGH94_06400 [Acidimicrobiales bacterium]
MRSTVSSVEVMIVRTPPLDVDLRCGGHPMIPSARGPSGPPGADPWFDRSQRPDPPGGTVDPDFDGQSEAGNRYIADIAQVEVLCTRAGRGILSVGDDPMHPGGGGLSGDREPRHPLPGAGSADAHA